MITLDDHTSWPQIGSIWAHHTGNIYRVLDFTNIETTRPDEYPVTIVYQNIHNGAKYSRRLLDWDRSMTLRHNP